MLSDEEIAVELLKINDALNGSDNLIREFGYPRPLCTPLTSESIKEFPETATFVFKQEFQSECGYSRSLKDVAKRFADGGHVPFAGFPFDAIIREESFLPRDLFNDMTVAYLNRFGDQILAHREGFTTYGEMIEEGGWRS